MGKEARIKYMFKVLCVHIFTCFFFHTCANITTLQKISSWQKKKSYLFVFGQNHHHLKRCDEKKSQCSAQ